MPENTENQSGISELELLAWVAYCSDVSHPFEKCRVMTDNILSRVPDTFESEGLPNIPAHVLNIMFNRKMDEEFINLLWSYKRRDLDQAVIQRCIFNEFSTGTTPDQYFDEYMSRYGVDDFIDTQRLRYYLSPENYEANRDKISEISERIRSKESIKE